MEDLKELLELIDKKKKIEEVYLYANEEFHYWSNKESKYKRKLESIEGQIRTKMKELTSVTINPKKIEELLDKNDKMLIEKLGKKYYEI